MVKNIANIFSFKVIIGGERVKLLKGKDRSFTFFTQVIECKLMQEIKDNQEIQGFEMGLYARIELENDNEKFDRD